MSATRHQDVRTYYMIERLLEQKRGMSLYVADHDLPTTLTANQWTLLETTMAILAPFEELTRRVSSSTTSIPDVILAATVLKCILGKESEADSGIETMKKSLLEACKKRFSTRTLNPYTLATLLDPRYKNR